MCYNAAYPLTIDRKQTVEKNMNQSTQTDMSKKKISEGRTREAKKSQRTTKLDTWSLRPPEDLVEFVDRAMAATGESKQQIVFACVRQALPDVVDRYLKARQVAEQKYGEWRSKGNKRSVV